jgi:4-hydroxyphenylpyruvate dioxygenase
MAPANPLGLDGLDFIEFASPNVAILEDLMKKFGMQEVARHKTKKLRLFRQNDISFLINSEPESFAMKFAAQHGPCASGSGFRVQDAQEAFELAVERGAKPFLDKKAELAYPAIYGIGDSLVYFIDQYLDKGDAFDTGDWEWLSQDHHPRGMGMKIIDHMTNNVPRGEMQKWCDFYTKVFGFFERRYFDIRGKSTGLISKVMCSPCGKFSIPINEPSVGAKSQIQEYLDEYKGSGIQHIAFLTNNIVEGVSGLMKNKIEFLAPPPETYYRGIAARVPKASTVPVDPLKKLGILVDGDDTGYLLQIFTKNQVGPIFIEIIQRAGHEGFGDGNFQALFDAMEEDQRIRGVL